MKQRGNGRPKANSSTQERLIARETFHYVTTNPKKYGVASTRNERQLAKAMDSLHMQKNKRLAKLTSQIHEVKVRQWKLKEVDDTIRDPRTTEKKLLGPKAEEVSDDTEPKHRDARVTRGQIGKHSKTSNTRNEEVLSLRKSRPSGNISTKASRQSRVKTNGHGRIIKHDRINGFDSKPTKTEDLHKTTIGSNRHTLTANDVSVEYALKDMAIKSDPHVLKYYKYKSYNLVSAQKSMGKRANTPREITKHTKEPSNEPQGVNNSREKISLNKNHIGKINRSPDARTRSGHVPKAPINYGHITNREPKSSLHEGSAVNHEAVSDQETEGREERPSVVEENWAETLKSCRYLRKPRGCETPEIPIESIFKND